MENVYEKGTPGEARKELAAVPGQPQSHPAAGIATRVQAPTFVSPRDAGKQAGVSKYMENTVSAPRMTHAPLFWLPNREIADFFFDRNLRNDRVMSLPSSSNPLVSI